MDIYNLGNPAYLEAKSLAKVWEAYAENCAGYEIFEIGFNDQSGYVYIALEDQITIASNFGQDVVFIVTDHDSGEEFFLDTYDEDEQQLNLINSIF